MKRTQSSMVMLALFVAVACTSTAEPPSGSSTPGGGTSTGASATQSETHGMIVFNRLASEGIAVYSFDLDSMTEERIRRVDDFVTLSPDGNRFLSAWPIPDGRIGPATFDIDGSGYSLLPIDARRSRLGRVAGRPTGAGSWLGRGTTRIRPARACTPSGRPTVAGSSPDRAGERSA